MSMYENIIDVLSGVVGTLGFCLFFRLRRNRLPVIAVTSAICYTVYLICIYFNASSLAANAISSLITAIIAECLAMFFKAPVTVFLIPSILPLIPGASLYYTMDALCRQDYHAALRFGSATMTAIGGIVAGIITVSTILKCVRDQKRNRKYAPSHTKKHTNHVTK